MIVRLCLKDPDGVYNSVMKAVRSQHCSDVSEETEAVMEELKPWVKYGEYVTVEINTSTGEAKVLKAS